MSKHHVVIGFYFGQVNGFVELPSLIDNLGGVYFTVIGNVSPNTVGMMKFRD
jgi:hypothetical protein